MAAKSARDKIIDTALDLATRQSWEALRLHDVAAELHLDLNEVRVCFREKEDITDAWFDRADAAMLHAGTGPGFVGLVAARAPAPADHGMARGAVIAPSRDAADDLRKIRTGPRALPVRGPAARQPHGAMAARGGAA